MTIIHIEQTVRDYDAWKVSFDSDPVDRKGSGVRRYTISRAADNPGAVVIDLELETTEQAEAMLASLRELWQGLGDVFVEAPTGRIFDVAEAKEL